MARSLSKADCICQKHTQIPHYVRFVAIGNQLVGGINFDVLNRKQLFFFFDFFLFQKEKQEEKKSNQMMKINIS